LLGQAHWPPTHAPLAQLTPQTPQLRGSLSRSVQKPKHEVCPGRHIAGAPLCPITPGVWLGGSSSSPEHAAIASANAIDETTNP
jgi:hypothetical protein